MRGPWNALNASVAEVGLPHCVQTNDGHAPDHRVDRAPLQHALLEFLGRKVLCGHVQRKHGERRQCDEFGCFHCSFSIVPVVLLLRFLRRGDHAFIGMRIAIICASVTACRHLLLGLGR